MNASGWALTAVMCAAAFLPALGARTPTARRWLVVAGTTAALLIGSLALASATSSGEGFFPSEAGWAFLLLGLPLGAGVATAGLIMVVTRRTQLPSSVRSVLAVVALAGVPALLIWRFVG